MATTESPSNKRSPADRVNAILTVSLSLSLSLSRAFSLAYPNANLGAASQPEFFENVMDMVFRGAGLDNEALGDLRVRKSAPDQHRHFALLLRQPIALYHAHPCSPSGPGAYWAKGETVCQVAAAGP